MKKLGHKKPDFFLGFLEHQDFLEIWGTFRKKWDFEVFLDDLEEKSLYFVCHFS